MRRQLSLGVLEPARELAEPARQPVEDGLFGGAHAQLGREPIEGRGQAVEVSPGLADDSGGPLEERSGGGDDARGLHRSLGYPRFMVPPIGFFGQALGG